MNLAEFKLKEEIYIDSNIFLYLILHNPKYAKSSHTFLERIEKGEINDVLSPLVVDEVTFKIIVEILKKRLSVTSNASALKRLGKKPELLNYAKAELLIFLSVITGYKGLKVISAASTTAYSLIQKTLALNLSPRDALHLAIMEHAHIKHIATADPHFEKIPSIQVWKP